jgi:ABC-2 type transport system ATP-binding protein
MRPSKGSVLHEGKLIWRKEKSYKRQLGVVFGQRSQLVWELPFIETLRFLRLLYHVTSADFTKALHLLTDFLDLKRLLSMPVREMSLGQRMRCEITASLIHMPRIIILDEATIGLDLAVKEKIYYLLKHISDRQDAAIIHSSHDVHDISAIAQRLLILHDGGFVYDGSPDQFLKRFSESARVKVTFNSPYYDIPFDVRTLGNVERISDYELVIEADEKSTVLKLLQQHDLLDYTEDISSADEDLRIALSRFYDEK